MVRDDSLELPLVEPQSTVPPATLIPEEWSRVRATIPRFGIESPVYWSELYEPEMAPCAGVEPVVTSLKD